MKYGSKNIAGRVPWQVGVLLLTVYCLLPTAHSQYGRPPESSLPRGGTPEVLKSVSIEQKLNEQVPLDAVFRDEAGRDVQLGEYFAKGKPVVLALVYYECPMMCNQILNALSGSLLAVSFTAGAEYEVVTVSFDAREGPELAARKKAPYMKRYGRAGAETGWHFLTGDQESIDRLTRAVGFNYVWDERSKQFAHSSAIMVATPEGRLSHYFYGIDYAPKELRLALVEASAGKIGSPVDQLVLFCYHYDPVTGKFAPVMNVVRAAGVLTVLGLVALIFTLRRKTRGGGGNDGDGGGERWDTEIDTGGAV
jgi:protein SCO1/2